MSGLAGVRLELCDRRFEAPEHHRRRERGEDDVEAHLGGDAHGRLTEAGDVDGRVRLLDWPRVDSDRIGDGVVLAVIGEVLFGPGFADELQLLVEAGPTLGERDPERTVLP